MQKLVKSWIAEYHQHCYIWMAIHDVIRHSDDAFTSFITLNGQTNSSRFVGILKAVCDMFDCSDKGRIVRAILSNQHGSSFDKKSMQLVIRCVSNAIGHKHSAQTPTPNIYCLLLAMNTELRWPVWKTTNMHGPHPPSLVNSFAWTSSVHPHWLLTVERCWKVRLSLSRGGFEQVALLWDGSSVSDLGIQPRVNPHRFRIQDITQSSGGMNWPLSRIDSLLESIRMFWRKPIWTP
jgi:hypothetical protein